VILIICNNKKHKNETINVHVNGTFLNKVDLFKYISIVVPHNTIGTTWVTCVSPKPIASVIEVPNKLLMGINNI